MIEKLDIKNGGVEDLLNCIKKINEVIDAVNELQNRIDPPSVYQVMKDKDAIIGKHIGEKQRLQDELDRTRKALDKAKNGLQKLKDIIACPPDISYETGVSMYADGVLKEITTPEQKE